MSRKNGGRGASVDVAGGQIQGQRADQEDAWEVKRFGPDECLAALADGLGGHPAGDVASHEAIVHFHAHVASQRRHATTAPGKWLEDGVIHAHEHLRELQAADAKLDGMATTFIGAYVRAHQLSAVAIGDSYLLLVRDGTLSRLNELHSEAGGVTSCIGFNLARIDVVEQIPLLAGDRLLLASDGIVTLAEDEIAAMLVQSIDAHAGVHNLLRAVEEAAVPHQDNTTVVALFL
jgi:serine/threonine protein phosphatase PrpC